MSAYVLQDNGVVGPTGVYVCVWRERERGEREREKGRRNGEKLPPLTWHRGEGGLCVGLL